MTAKDFIEEKKLKYNAIQIMLVAIGNKGKSSGMELDKWMEAYADARVRAFAEIVKGCQAGDHDYGTIGYYNGKAIDNLLATFLTPPNNDHDTPIN